MPGKKIVLMYSPAAQKLIEAAIEYKYLHLGRAIQAAIHAYSGMKRKNGQDEVDHSIAVTWSLWERGIKRDEHLAKAILHDLVESSKENSDYIRERFGDEIADDIGRLTRRPGEKGEIDDDSLDEAFSFISRYYHQMKTNWFFRKHLSENRRKLLKMLPEAYKKPVGEYYGRLAESAICLVIKNFDKIDIFKNMAYTLKERKQKLQIIEYEAFLAMACKAVRKISREYLEVLFAGRDEIESYIDNVIYQLQLADKLDAAKKEIADFRKRSARHEKP